MAKIKTNKIHKPLVVTGYISFALLVASVFISTTIPFATILAQPNSIKLNVTIIMISLTVGALLPVLVGYFIGDTSVKSKSKLTHHFSGMLFGLLAYWWMTLITVFVSFPAYLVSDNNIRIMLMNFVPSIFVAIITTTLAVMHVRSKQARHDVLEYKPFVIVLAASVLAMPLSSVVNNFMTNSVNVYTFIVPSIIFAIGCVTYLTLKRCKLSKLQKVAWSSVAVSVLFLLVFVANMFETALVGYLWQPSAEVQSVSTWMAFVTALVAWLIYWIKQVKSLSVSSSAKK